MQSTSEFQGASFLVRTVAHFLFVARAVNPLKYSDIAGLQEEHAIGEVWANMLFNVFGDLVKERGFSQSALTQPNGFEGNVVFMRIMMDSFLLQPCNPSCKFIHRLKKNNLTLVTSNSDTGCHVSG